MLFQEKKERVFSYEKSFSMNILISSSSHFPLGGGGGGSLGKCSDQLLQCILPLQWAAATLISG